MLAARAGQREALQTRPAETAAVGAADTAVVVVEAAAEAYLLLQEAGAARRTSTVQRTLGLPALQ